MQRAYAQLLQTARRRSRLAHEAEDIVQDALIIALEAGRADLGDPGNRLWLNGIIRNQARMRARSAMRLKARESVHADTSQPASAAGDDRAGVFHWIHSLPVSLRPVAALAFTGHSRAEIRSVLGIADTALRQRLQALKRAALTSGLEPDALLALRGDLAHGLLRRALPQALVRRQGSFGTYDPDGNLLIFRTPRLTNRTAAATGT